MKKMTDIADAVCLAEGRILLVQQRKPKAYGKWSFPGGHVEKGETPEMAIVREIEEELGMTVEDAGIFRQIVHEEGASDEGSLRVTTFILPLKVQEIYLQHEELIGFGWFTAAEMRYMAEGLRSPWMLSMATAAQPTFSWQQAAVRS